MSRPSPLPRARSRIRARFAPSPTGDLHFGGAWTALASWALARASGGVTILRMEDIDRPRVVPGSAERIVEDLAWLGLDWDEGALAHPEDDGATSESYTQSRRSDLYEDAIATLDRAGLVYPCDCSRTEIARAASAPHAGEERVYPGLCRDAPRDRELKRDPALRLRVPENTTIAFHDLVRGDVEQRVDASVGDFVLRRGDGIFAYQLVVAVDDARMRVSHVVRADDLLGSTARQILLMRLLGFAEQDIPTYAHIPMVVLPDGERLAKRAGAASIQELRRRGISVDEIIGTLAHGLGLVSGEPRPLRARDVAAQLEPPSEWRKEPWPVPAAWI